MRKALILLLLFTAYAFADTNATTQFSNVVGSSSVEMAKNWQLYSIGAIMLSVILVAIAYAIGIGFELPEIKAWAGSELVQIFTNAIIVVALIAAIALIEVVVLGMAQASNLGVSACMPGAPGGTSSMSCLQATTEAYLSDEYNTANDKARSVLQNSVAAGAWMNRRLGITCVSIYCAQIGISGTFMAQNVLYLDKYGIIFEYYMNLLSFMNAQRFFVQAISFNMAPVVLAIGIVMRSFFLSRKLGGLLMAIAIGCMFFFPGMYIFDWLTLDMATNGDKPYGDQDNMCPAECGLMAPLAVVQNGGSFIGLNSSVDVYRAFDQHQELAIGVLDGTIPGASATTTNNTDPGYGKYIESCNYGTAPGPEHTTKDGETTSTSHAKDCPMTCRELPYPAISECVNLSRGTPYDCSLVPAECKVVRQVAEIDTVQRDSCPQACKVIPPLKNNCNFQADGVTPGGHCLDSSYECRMAKMTNLAWRPTKPSEADPVVQGLCIFAQQCTASTTAASSCVYVVPPVGRCDQEASDTENICKDCPNVCRVDAYASNPALAPAECKVGNSLLPACVTCHAGCKARYAEMQSLSGLAAGNGSCLTCPMNHRVLGTNLPLEYTSAGTTQDCSYQACSKEYRVTIPRNVCESCLFTDEQYVYEPPINNKCSALCKPPDNAPVQKPGTSIGGDGLAGDADIQDLSRLMVPVYALPLFNIVATLVFIRGLAVFLGGDIEIPGISKVF
jgi:hypothetical protein